MCDETGHNFDGAGVEGSVTSGVGNQFLKTRRHTFEISLLKPNSLDAVWTSEPTLVDCAEGLHHPSILGVNEFLRFFRIDINYPVGVFTLHL